MEKRSTIFFGRRRGLALVLVIMVMALASIMGYAMLSSSTLQATASSNSLSAAVADAQMESGVHLALYYLQNPQYAPAGFITGTPITTTFTSGQTAIPGSVTITLTKPTGTTNIYSVYAVGSSQGATSGGGAITRGVTAVAQINTVYLVNQAVGTNSLITIPAGVTFSSATNAAIESNQAVTIQASAAVVGNIDAPSVTNHGTYNGQTSSAPTEAASPTSTNVTNFETYTYQGATYNATPLPSATLSNTVLVPDPVANPLGVYWYNGNLTIASHVTITGTLIVKNGKLSVTGTNNTIVAQPNMPALLVDRTLSITNGDALSVTGVAWTGQGVAGVGSVNGTNLQINGALLIDSGGVTNIHGTMNVTYNPSVVAVPNLSTANQTPVSAQLITWTPN